MTRSTEDAASPTRRWRRIRILGRGAQSEVWLVHARSGTDAQPRLGVMKRLLADATPERVGRLRHEARLRGTLRAPGIASLIEMAEVRRRSSQRIHLVTEHVPGRTLSEVLAATGPMPDADVRRLGIHLARALAGLHGAGWVHRDLKPENVLVAEDGSAWLLDLELARRAGTADTEGGLFDGSPSHAAPERIIGTPAAPAADLYALGLLLFEAASGTNPFLDADAHVTLRRHVRMPPPSLRKVLGEAGAFLDAVVAALLVKDPSERLGPASRVARVLAGGERGSWWRERGNRVTPVASPGAASALPGREAELASLRQALLNAVDGAGGVFLVEGEAGMGKSRLAAEACQELRLARPGLALLGGPPASDAMMSITNILRRDMLDWMGRDDLESRLAALMPGSPRMASRLAAQLAARAVRPGLGGELTQAHASLARELAARRPVVWLIEDLHALSAADRRLLAPLARAAADRPFVVLFTTRPVDDEALLGWIAAIAPAFRMTLAPMGRDSMERLVAASTGSPAIAEALAPVLQRRSLGNPMFALALLGEALRVAGSDGRDADADGVVAALAALPVPESLRELVAAKVAGLAEEERDVLSAAAVHGGVVRAGLLARALGRRPSAVAASLARLARTTRLVRARGEGFDFEHPLVREAVDAALDPAGRTRLHAAIAAAAEAPTRRLGPLVLGSRSAFIAGHHVRSGSIPDVERVILPALDDLEARHEAEALVVLADGALALIRETHPRLRAEVQVRRGMALNTLVRRADQLAAAQDAVAAAGAAGDRSVLARALRLLARSQAFTRDLEGAVATAAEAARIAGEVGDARTQAMALAVSGAAFKELGRYRDAERDLRGSMSVAAAAAEITVRHWAQVDLAGLYIEQGQHDVARPLLEQSLTHYREHDDPRAEAVVLHNLAYLHFDRGEFDRAIELALARIDLSQQIGFYGGMLSGHSMVGSAHACCGRLGPARVHLERARAVAKQVENANIALEPVVLLNLATLSMIEGRLDEAVRDLDELSRLAQAAGQRRFVALGMLHRADVARARSLAAAAEGATEASRASRQEARDLLDSAVGEFRDMCDAPDIARACWCLGEASLRDGDRESARAHLEEASALVARHGFADPGCLPDAALAVLGLKRVADVVIPDRAAIQMRAEAHLLLHAAGGGMQHLEKARQLVERVSSHLSGADLDLFWRQSPLGRRLREAAGG